MRKKKAPKRYVQPDPKFNDIMVTQFVNRLMWSGEKSTAYRLFYDAIELVEDRAKENGLELWRKALQNVGPSVEVRTRRIGGANFQIPTEVRADRKSAIAMKWIIQYSRSRNGKSMADKLAAELISAAKGEGGAFKKKEDTHKMAEANKAFAHFKF